MANTRSALVLIFSVCSLHLYCQVNGAKPVAQKIVESRSEGFDFKTTSPFNVQTDATYKSASSLFANNITYAKLNVDEIQNLYTSKHNAISLTLPFKNENLILDLVRVDLFAEDFKVYTSGQESPVDYHPGIYYQGIIKDDPTSLVAISIFEDEMMGTVSKLNSGNINIGRYKKGFIDDYLIYSDADILVDPQLGTCETTFDPDYLEAYNEIMQNVEGSRDVKCPKIYFEADYDIYLNYGLGTVSGTADYVTNLFNNSNAIFTNEFVSTEIQTIFIWTTPDIYSDLSSGDKLASFSAYRPSFTGDIAQLLAIYGGGGGLASTVNGLCNGYGYSVSWISGTYSDYPTYSWPVFVVTHEIGHLFGSAHTQSCFAWVGGALDNCYTTEGGCPTGPEPIDGGTIMSYCHVTAYGVNFANGFGPQPGDAIRNTIAAAYCIDACGIYNYNPYCYPFPFNTDNQWIQSVKMAGVASITGNNGGFGNFIGTTFNLTQGINNTIKITPGYPGIPIDVSIGAWIDFNKDGDFFDAGEEIVNSAAITSTLTAVFFCPTGLSGTTRMRVLLKYGGPITTPCDIFFGEAEDYTISFDTPVIYCTSSGLESTNRYIDNIKLNEISRVSASDGGYYDGTATSTNLTQGTTYTLTYSAGFAGIAEQLFWRAWIDFNGDGDFTDAGEKIFQKKITNAGNLNKNITIPISAIPGTTRLRVSAKYGAYASPCENFASGEVEDYTINILPALIPQNKPLFEWNIYPNPTNGELNINYKNTFKGGVVVSIFSITGVNYFNSNSTGENGEIYINIENAPAGIYFIKLTQLDGSVSVKHFVKF